MTADNPRVKDHAYREAQMMRWAGRIISSIAAAIWLLILLVTLLCDLIVGCITITWEAGFLVFLVAVSVISVVLAWRREVVGGLVMLIWGCVFSIIAYITSRPYQLLSIFVSGIPFILAGSLFLVSSWRSRSAMSITTTPVV